MKTSNLTKAVALASFAFAGQAFALAPTVTPDLVVNISGASAQQLTMGHILKKFCNNDLDTYLDKPTTGSAGSAYRSYFCTISSDPLINAPANLVGKKVLFNTRAKGGSVWGVVPLGRGWNVQYLNIGYNGGSHCSLTATNTYECTYTSPSTALLSDGECPKDSVDYSAQDRQTKCVRSDAGVSDVEPAMFVNSNLPAGWSALTASELGGLAVSSEYGVVFGVAVTNDVYAALQNMQGLSGTQVPSLTKAQITGILTGGIKSWKELDTFLTTAPASTSYPISSSATSGFMSVCRRANGSGTQAAQNAFFLNAPCASGFGVNASMVTASASSSTYKVLENSSAGAVGDCLNKSVTAGALVGSGTAKFGGIGLMAIEKQPTASDKWKYIKIDGVEPTVDNAISTAYNNVFEQTLQWPSTTSGDTLEALQMLLQASGDPAILNA
ncbi:MAG TPA: hypothetical protein VFV48_05305, partial [Pseudomonadales bacterium]|nr:hypothetical protein [Pseudomonadales bacterium]